MLDKSEKTRQLMALLKTALPFEVTLTPELIATLARQQNPVAVKSTETVSQISYAGDEGGILCHIRPEGAESMVVALLTHVRVARRRNVMSLRATASWSILISRNSLIE